MKQYTWKNIHLMHEITEMQQLSISFWTQCLFLNCNNKMTARGLEHDGRCPEPKINKLGHQILRIYRNNDALRVLFKTTALMIDKILIYSF